MRRAAAEEGLGRDALVQRMTQQRIIRADDAEHCERSDEEKIDDDILIDLDVEYGLHREGR